MDQDKFLVSFETVTVPIAEKSSEPVEQVKDEHKPEAVPAEDDRAEVTAATSRSDEPGETPASEVKTSPAAGGNKNKRKGKQKKNQKQGNKQAEKQSDSVNCGYKKTSQLLDASSKSDNESSSHVGSEMKVQEEPEPDHKPEAVDSSKETTEPELIPQDEGSNVSEVVDSNPGSEHQDIVESPPLCDKTEAAENDAEIVRSDDEEKDLVSKTDTSEKENNQPEPSEQKNTPSKPSADKKPEKEVHSLFDKLAGGVTGEPQRDKKEENVLEKLSRAGEKVSLILLFDMNQCMFCFSFN